MAGQSRRLTRVYVLDTSYLLEIYGVPGHCDDVSRRTIKSRLRRAIKADSRLYVPFPVIFELANHIAHVADGGRRIALARRLSEDIRNSVHEGFPWSVTPVPTQSVLLELSGFLGLVQDFERDGAAQGIGLCDLAVAALSGSLTRRFPGRCVHIWTKDRGLKALEPEPEPEPDPFLGR